MGVWIETTDKTAHSKNAKSHPVWVCGLKQVLDLLSLVFDRSHPVWVCGLKLFGQCQKEVGFGHTLYGCVD